MLSHRCFEPSYFAGDLFQKMDGRAIHIGVHRVQAQSVDVVIAQPHQRIVDQEAAYFRGAGFFEIDRVAPGRGVAVGEIRSKFSQVITHRAEVVVDHVQQHGEPFAMAGIHEVLKIVRLSVGIENCVQIHAVIAPSTLAGEIRDRHQLHVGHTQGFQIVQTGLCRFQSSLGRKRAQVQLVNKGARKRRRLPVAGRSTRTQRDRPAGTHHGRNKAAIGFADRGERVPTHRSRTHSPCPARPLPRLLTNSPWAFFP